MHTRVVWVQGEGLQTECMQSAKIFIGRERCNKTTVVNDKLIQCSPPTQQPSPVDSTDNLPSVVVRTMSQTFSSNYDNNKHTCISITPQGRIFIGTGAGSVLLRRGTRRVEDWGSGLYLNEEEKKKTFS